MRFLLDTNVVVDYLNGRYPAVVRRVQGARPDELGVSVVALAELRYGAEKSAQRDQNHARLDTLLEDLSVLKLDVDAAREYGCIRSQLERLGAPIGPNDLLIAAQAVAGDLTLVTADATELRRVPGLRVENWRE